MSKKILAPIDLEHESSWKTVLPKAIMLAKAMDAEVSLMTVVPHIVAGLDWRYSIRGATQGSLEYSVKDLIKQATDRLTELAKQELPAKVRGDVFATSGTVYEEIVNRADDINADLIVMMSNRPSLRSYLLGPNAARVTRHASCSVHIVRD